MVFITFFSSIDYLKTKMENNHNNGNDDDDDDGNFPFNAFFSPIEKIFDDFDRFFSGFSSIFSIPSQDFNNENSQPSTSLRDEVLKQNIPSTKKQYYIKER